MATWISSSQIEEAIIVIIRPGAANRRTAIVDDPARRDPGERRVTSVPIKRVVLVEIPTDEQGDLPVVVVVRPGRNRPVSGFADGRTIGDAAEGPIAIVPK